MKIQLLFYKITLHDYLADRIDQLRTDFSYESAPQIADCWIDKHPLTSPKWFETLHYYGWLLYNCFCVINQGGGRCIAHFAAEECTRRYPGPYRKLSCRGLTKVINAHHRHIPPSDCIRKRLVVWCWVWAKITCPSMAKRVKNHPIFIVPPGWIIGVVGE